jgi:hypothetical protein
MVRNLSRDEVIYKALEAGIQDREGEEVVVSTINVPDGRGVDRLVGFVDIIPPVQPVEESES